MPLRRVENLNRTGRPHERSRATRSDIGLEFAGRLLSQ